MDQDIEHCARCLRSVPASDDPQSDCWQALGSDRGAWVCPDCITPEEHKVIDDYHLGLAPARLHLV
jgi:hypothetical protein